MKKRNRKKKTNRLWRVWAKALGSKASKSDKESDCVAIVRTLIMIQLVITNGFIIANAIRHWNNVDNDKVYPIEVLPYSTEIR